MNCTAANGRNPMDEMFCPKFANAPRNILLLLLAGIGLSATSSLAQGKPQPAELIFDVSGLECGACVYSVQQALKEAKGVSDVEVMQTPDGYARVVFDREIVSEHQLAQAVREAFPLHGSPYLIKLRLRIPAYAKADIAAKVDAVFAKWQKWVDVKPTDKARGEFLVQFKPLQKDPKANGPQGWTLAELTQALKAPAPEGLGLEVAVGQ
jgi:copper chaperone CopZ